MPEKKTAPKVIVGSSSESKAAEQSHVSKIKEQPLQTVQERIANGKSARVHCQRESHAAWEAPQDRPDPIDVLETQAKSRIPELIPIRYGRMLASPFAFYRGAAAIMASDLAHTPNSGLEVQLCGDAHLSNFGGFASPERELILDINDFDETLPGSWEWDVKRLAASVEVASRERGFNTKLRRDLVIATIREYRQAMREFSQMGFLALWYLHLSPQAVQARWGMSVNRKIMQKFESEFSQAYHRDNQRALEKLTHMDNGRLKIVAHPPLVVPIEDILSAEDQKRFEAMIQKLIRSYSLTLQPDRQYLLKSYQYMHLARKVVGIGSVGTRSWIMLLLGRDQNDPLFLQVKEAQSSVLEPYLGRSAYAEHGKRVVVGQKLIQSASDIFLGWDRVQADENEPARDYYIRQLWDWKISADLGAMPAAELMVYAKMCGWALARAHARSGDRIAISAYLGKGEAFDQALNEFAIRYADQNERDYQALVKASRSKRIHVETGK